MMPRRDSLGRHICIGDKVAYNLSGDVVPGVVIDIHPGHIKISRVARGSRAHGHGKMSRVKNPQGILVLAGKDEPDPYRILNAKRRWTGIGPVPAAFYSGAKSVRRELNPYRKGGSLACCR